MKKLMCAISAAALCGAVFADITSANVVGYQNKALTGDSMNDFVVRTMVPVGVEWEDVTLGDLTGTNQDEDGNGGWDFGQDFLMTLQENGLVEETYAYITPYWATALAGDGYSCAGAGWYLYSDIEQEIFTNKQDAEKLNFRQGFKVNVQSGTAVTLNNAGEVINKGWIPVALTGNSMNDFTGNITPVKIHIGDILGTDQDEDGNGGWDFGQDFLMTLLENGLVKETYAYITPYWAAALAGDGYECAGAGWYLYSDIEQEIFTNLQNDKVEFEPGQAFKVNIQSGTEVQLLFPSALGTK